MAQPRIDIEQPKKPADVLVNPQSDAARQSGPVDAPEVNVEDELEEEAGDDKADD